MKSARLPDLDAAALAGLAALGCARFLPAWVRGLTPYWGDLTYIHQPWRAFDAKALAAGRLPLWNPFLYFGMPQAATMQDSLYYPGTAPFFFFGFATATGVFHALHYGLAGALAYLWLRSLRLRRVSAFGGAALFSLGGLLLVRLSFLNHLAALSLMPGLLLFFRRPALLGLTLAASFFAGYPPFLIGGAAAAWATAAALATRGGGRAFWSQAARAWSAAAALAAGLSGCLLFPAFELAAASRRAAGVPMDEALAFGFAPKDLLQWVSPWLVRGFKPHVDWTLCCYLGFVGCAAAAAGAAAAAPRRRWALIGALSAVAVLILGASNPASRWLWAHCPPLRFIRYPGNTAFAALLPLSALAAAGLERWPRRMLFAGALCAELLLCGWGRVPAAPRGLWTSAGPLVRLLQESLEGHRYLLSPLALETHAGAGVEDWRQRLYGLTNAPFRLRAAGNFGEPLVPRANYELMDALYSSPSAAAAARLFPWADVKALLAPRPLEAPGLAYEGERLWHVHRFSPAAGAWRLSARDGESLPLSLDGPLPALGKPLSVERPREDAVAVRAEGGPAGWVFLSEPRYAGWRAWLETPLGAGGARAMAAVGPFQKIQVPAGAWGLHLRYRPGSFFWGFLLSAASAWLLAVYWYNRARMAHES